MRRLYGGSVLLLGLAALFLGGCGGSSGGDDNPPDTDDTATISNQWDKATRDNAKWGD